MCGIAGILDLGRQSPDGELHAHATAMAEAIAYRGPDDSGVWTEPGCVALAHRRLAIIDVSPAGHQPMVSSCGRYVLVYNGEVYNAAGLKTKLEGAGYVFNGHSDTEVIVEGIARWGLETTVRRLAGMFAFAAWDRRDRVLHLVRDRIGIKPLYWGKFGRHILFGSELKSLAAHPAWRGEVDRSALASYLRFGYVPAPQSIWRNVEKLEPGQILAVGADGAVTKTVYWSALDAAAHAGGHQGSLGAVEATGRLDELLRYSVRSHMVSDVPLGAFLSGGIDSSTVIALMQAQSTNPVQTFSIGFHEQGYDEAVHAREIAAHLGTRHTELYVEPSHALSVIPMLPAMYDEPLGDSSQIPTFLVSEMTRRHVTIALSGDGGDELFGGYSRYAYAEELWSKINRVPLALRRIVSAAAGRAPLGWWDWLLGCGPSGSRARLGSARIRRFAQGFGEDFEGLYARLVGHWAQPLDVVRDLDQVPAHPWGPEAETVAQDRLSWMQLADILSYLPDDILTKVDRASMAVSLESRVPLLDHHVVEFALSLPRSLKVAQGQSKWLLRQVLYKYVPRALVDRPKMGFGVPIDTWLRGPLRDWAETLLAEDRLRREGFLNPGPIREIWNQHQTGQGQWQYLLWTVLMFQAWLENQKSNF